MTASFQRQASRVRVTNPCGPTVCGAVYTVRSSGAGVVQDERCCLGLPCGLQGAPQAGGACISLESAGHSFQMRRCRLTII